MALTQTVFDVGDLITSRINLGLTPDGSTTTAFAVYRPDGTTISGLNASAWVGQEKTLQFYATDDGTASGTKLAASGDWLVVWTIGGLGASVSPKIYNVRPLPGVWNGRVGWTPFLSDVADYVPFLTVDVVTPGSQIYLGTFTGSTSPTDEQANRVIDKAVALTSIPTVGTTTMPPLLEPAAKTIASLRAAAMLARTYARNDTDLQLADALDVAADSALAALIVQVGEQGGGAGSGPAPVGYFPEPASYPGDHNV